MEDSIKMVVAGKCPHCMEDIIININNPHPTVDIIKPGEVDEDIKNLLDTQDDITQEPEAPKLS